MRELIDPDLFGPENTCFGCSPRNAFGMKLQFYKDGDQVVTEFTGKTGWDGPPGILHGGLQATLADELGAWTLVGLKGNFGFTTKMDLRYYRPSRLGEPIEGRGRIVSDADGVAVVQVTLRQDGKRVLSGKITYALPTMQMAERVIGRELPDSWKALARDG